MNSSLNLLILLLFSVPLVFCKRCGCYSDASLIDLPNTTLYSNLTLQSCECLFSQQNRSSFQYNSSDQTCCIFDSDIASANLRVAPGCKVCFCNQTTTVDAPTSTTSSSLPSPPINVSTAVQGNNYYTVETVYLTNYATLTSLKIVITAPKTLGANSPQIYGNYWSQGTNCTWMVTNTDIIATFYLIPGWTMAPNSWNYNLQFALTGTNRPTVNDTYRIQIDSFQTIDGHF
ncbi:unnamed protein product [Adineta ricciae]|uniref:CUB-like domain-containing protein n=1 Tax=Adineta ricciae TaxID=249248 RepID=A0A813Q1K4_ADIRI|nr:unnamed protein product [Adineta ricciae]CAF1110471.1 unnamed protein product [Adineta ricciae]